MSYLRILESRNAFLLIVLVLFQPGCTENGKQEAKSDSNNNAALFRKEVHTIYSDIMQDSFEIRVSLPAVYYQRDTVFPVIYSTDANRNFGIISDVVNALMTLYNESEK